MSERKRYLNSLKSKEYWEWRKSLSRKGDSHPKPFKGRHHTEINKKFLREKRLLNKLIKCNETGKIYEAQKDVALDMKLRQGHISEHLNGKRCSVKGFTFKYIEKKK